MLASRDSTPTCISYTELASAKTCRSCRELILKRGSGKRRQGEREFEAIPNPWPGPRGSDFGARPSMGSAESDCSRFHIGLQEPIYTGAGWGSYCCPRSASSCPEWGLLEPRRATPADKGDGIKAPGTSHPWPILALRILWLKTTAAHSVETHSVALSVAYFPGLRHASPA